MLVQSVRESAEVLERIVDTGSARGRCDAIVISTVIRHAVLSERAARVTLEISLTVIGASFALCRFPASDLVPAWTESNRSFLTISRTPTELSIVADDAVVPPGASADRPYRALRVDGPMSLELVGVMARISTALAAAEVPIFPIATYDTDYILVHEDFLSRSVAALESAGHHVRFETSE
jgi:hypothetical protein